MHQAALDSLVDILANEKEVNAIFVKGSFGRGEQDPYSDIDLYCLVEEHNLNNFLAKRLPLLSKYKDVLYSEELFIIAPQLIIVYDDFLHVDLFTVTEKTFKQSDHFKVLYDPDQLLDQFKGTQKLTMTDEEYGNQIIDLTWFLFQYRKAALRENSAWAAAMLQQVTDPLSRMLLHHYAPDRAQLGLKRAEQLLPSSIYNEFNIILENVTPAGHQKAAAAILQLLAKEQSFIENHLKGTERQIINPLFQKIVTEGFSVNT
ncbi:nucleotidyltransferase domain-containing protein [Terribacillus saccharophilus]|uniref:nucleotidyltransferase domain-containing protein n=1 Tax=Terribacillus saccharophilus TaxID=361277 RepID=UPI000C9C4859|nr:nucleotidyltransferase domain-containing protein [Terribacillus goriensis]